MSKKPEELVVEALNDVKEIFANIWGHGYEAGIKAADKATEKRVVDEVMEIVKTATCRQKIIERVDRLRKKYAHNA